MTNKDVKFRMEILNGSTKVANHKTLFHFRAPCISKLNLPGCTCDMWSVSTVAVAAATAPDDSADCRCHSAGFLADLSDTFGFEGGSLGCG